jgi:hypothetical protein
MLSCDALTYLTKLADGEETSWKQSDILTFLTRVRYCNSQIVLVSRKTRSRGNKWLLEVFAVTSSQRYEKGSEHTKFH